MATATNSPVRSRFLPPTWEASLADKAGVVVLQSGEFQDVLAGTGIDSWELRRQLWEAAPELILTAPDYLIFDQVVDLAGTWHEASGRLRQLKWPLRRWGWAGIVLALLAVVVTAAVLIADLLGWLGPGLPDVLTRGRRACRSCFQFGVILGNRLGAGKSGHAGPRGRPTLPAGEG